MVKQVIVNTEATILRVELLSPFSYFVELKNNVGGSDTIIEEKQKPVKRLVNVRDYSH